MKLTRRDAVAALAAAGIAVGGGAAVIGAGDRSESDGQSSTDGDDPLGDHEIETLIAAAEELYPSAVENVGTFVETYAQRRAEAQPEHAAGIADAVAYLDEYSESWFDRPFGNLDESTRGEALRDMRADTADPDPEGSDVERVRYYVVNELLYALYTSPTGGKLCGIENPIGHPGGLGSYQRGPADGEKEAR